MTTLAKILLLVVSAVLIYYGLLKIIAPQQIEIITDLTPETAFGTSSIRAMAAPLLMIGTFTVFGILWQRADFLLPVVVYFLFLSVVRAISVLADGADPAIVRSLGLAVFFLIICEAARRILIRKDG